ncbi:hypothetical protein FOL47_005733, partial [Perkinsus chesapeaki]
DCPKNSRSGSKPQHSKSATNGERGDPRRDETVLLTLGKAEVLSGTVEVSTRHHPHDNKTTDHARAGFDTMCSQNLVTRGLLTLLGATAIPGEGVRLQTAGGAREANEWVTLTVKRPSFQVDLPFLVVDTLPGVDLLVRKADLVYLGYQIVDHAPVEEPT